jgi:hypothetical protein
VSSQLSAFDDAGCIDTSDLLVDDKLHQAADAAAGCGKTLSKNIYAQVRLCPLVSYADEFIVAHAKRAKIYPVSIDQPAVFSPCSDTLAIGAVAVCNQTPPRCTIQQLLKLPNTNSKLLTERFVRGKDNRALSLTPVYLPRPTHQCVNRMHKARWYTNIGSRTFKSCKNMPMTYAFGKPGKAFSDPSSRCCAFVYSPMASPWSEGNSIHSENPLWISVRTQKSVAR